MRISRTLLLLPRKPTALILAFHPQRILPLNIRLTRRLPIKEWSTLRSLIVWAFRKALRSKIRRKIRSMAFLLPRHPKVIASRWWMQLLMRLSTQPRNVIKWQTKHHAQASVHWPLRKKIPLLNGLGASWMRPTTARLVDAIRQCPVIHPLWIPFQHSQSP